MFRKFFQELISFQKSERLFIFFAMVVGFSIAAEYGITRPASNSLFLTLFSSHAFPWVWLATVPLNLLIITLYNRFLPRLGPWKMLATIAIAVTVVNCATGWLLAFFPGLIFFQFAWKDIYVLLMFKQLWSLIHSTIPSHRAKYLYGAIFGVGTVGSVLGSLIPGFLAVEIGSQQIFYFTVPIYALLLWSYRKAYHYSALSQTSFPQDLSTDHRPREGFALIFRSRFLLSILLLVILMQVSVALLEFQFNARLEQNILSPDLRTEYMGRMVFFMNLISGLFQWIGSFLLVHTLGVRGSHLTIPLLLIINAVGTLFVPSFGMLSFAFVFIKAVDFSLFGITREMLYIPLQLDEKFRAKAVIDVFAYRTSKALVSLCILALQFFATGNLLFWISGASLGVLILWIGVVWFLLRKHYPKTPIPQM
ncbi:MAG: hypothetical protein KGJ02_03145 [Verrucomicrobiota bacterium]|nr:hypothetical protein [Verrucomicrobiota bacterium]